MARFLGNASGRTSVPYTDTTVGLATVGLLQCTGSAAGLTGNVTGLTAGSGISINQSTGNVTVTASAGGATPTILYACNGCWDGSATIPGGSLGVYSRYEIFGQTRYWQYYCSQATFAFAGACAGACADNFASYCCAHCTSGWVGDHKCFNSGYHYDCGGAIAWPFGCAGGCLTACSIVGFHFHASMVPENVCCGSQRGFAYCFATSMNGGNYGSPCCIGVRNSGCGCSCCGGHPACLKGVCFTTPSANNPYACMTNVVIVGYGKITP